MDKQPNKGKNMVSKVTIESRGLTRNVGTVQSSIQAIYYDLYENGLSSNLFDELLILRNNLPDCISFIEYVESIEGLHSLQGTGSALNDFQFNMASDYIENLSDLSDLINLG